MDKTLKAKLIQLIIECGIALLIFIIGLNPNLVESIYSTGVFPIIAALLRFVNALFPFSIGDLLYVIIIAYILRSLNLIYRKYNSKRFEKVDKFKIPIQFINFTLILYIAFKMLWGLNYNRPAIAKKLGISNDKYSTAQLVKLGNYFLAKLNLLKPAIAASRNYQLSYDIGELETTAAASYKKLAKVNSVFTYGHPVIKPCLNSWMVSKMGIEGYYNPLSGEANINMRLPAFVMPFTTCHEIAHQTGIAKEDEANLIGYIAAINSPDLDFQYAAYYCIFRYILFEIKMKSPADYKIIYEQIDAGVLKDFKTENDFWRQNNSAMSGYINTAFDSLLKLNNQKKGIASYQDIVLWLYNFHKDDL